MDKVLEAFNRGYVISLEGIAYNKYGIKVGHIGVKGYWQVSLKINGTTRHVKNHRLQAFQKYGHKMFEEGILVRHLDGDKLNNSWENILIGTDSDNKMDVPKQIRISRAVHAASFKKKYDDESIRKFHAISKSYKKTMEKFNISSKGTLNYILKN